VERTEESYKQGFWSGGSGDQPKTLAVKANANLAADMETRKRKISMSRIEMDGLGSRPLDQ